MTISGSSERGRERRDKIVEDDRKEEEKKRTK
jgi:hypothetical protein